MPEKLVTTASVDSSGYEVFLLPSTIQSKTEDSGDIRVGSGKIEHHSSGHFSYEIAGNTIVKVAIVVVTNEGDPSQYLVGCPLTVGQSSQTLPWATVTVQHEYLQGKRVFTVNLDNWSHNWARHMHLHLEYEQGEYAEEYDLS